MSLARATGQQLIDFSLNEYATLFPATRGNKAQQAIFTVTRYLFRAVVKVLERLPFCRNLFITVTYETTGAYSPLNAEFIARLRRRSLTLIRFEGYFDISKLVFPEPKPIREVFTIDPDLAQTVRDHSKSARGHADILIGLHIRRGDYDVHLGGKHYYSLEFYRQVMDAMLTLFPGRQVAFLVCSNEKLPMEMFASLNATMGPGTLLGDLYSLAECDHIIGPPSTFSLWAAFHGLKPIHLMLKSQVPVSLDQFMIPDGHFECFDLNIF